MSTTTIQLQSPSTFQLGSIYARGSAIPKPGCKFVLEEQLGDVAYLDTWDEEDKAMTRIVKGSIIKFGPGLNIVDLVTGFESCILHIKNLPEDATDYEIRTLLMQHDLDITRFAFIGVERNAGGKLEAQIMTDSTAGGTLHSDSGRLHFRGSKLEIELSTSSFAGTASTQDPVVFTAAPYFQTARYITEYFDGGSSCAKLCQSNGRSLNGHCAIAVTKLSSNHQCPVCYDSISTPLQLGCGHTYCITCLRHLLDTAHEIGQFPLTCVGDESQCQAPIAIPTIQEFLSQTPFNQLLEAASTAPHHPNLHELFAAPRARWKFVPHATRDIES
ncbi:hypothetical protein ID866_5492 [Astraeus odoratus]|nr:hypothetical protein ID866_5492 [Astraeus odoratus]